MGYSFFPMRAEKCGENEWRATNVFLRQNINLKCLDP